MPSGAVDPTGWATVLLVALTAVWGSTFFLIHELVETLSPVDFLAVRFVIAAAIMAVLFHRALRSLRRPQVLVGIRTGRPLRWRPDRPDPGPGQHTGEGATWRMLVGGALVLTAMYAVELSARRRPGELPALPSERCVRARTPC